MAEGYSPRHSFSKLWRTHPQFAIGSQAGFSYTTRGASPTAASLDIGADSHQEETSHSGVLRAVGADGCADQRGRIL
jgi:hypothetical protein